MDTEEKQEIILNFIKKHKIAVLATVFPNHKPEAAVIEFGETDDLELIFDTISTYRKYKNLKQNKNVAFVIGWDEDITVQYEGIAQELSGRRLERYQRLYWKKNPSAQHWMTNSDIRYFKVIPKWIRYSVLENISLVLNLCFRYIPKNITIWNIICVFRYDLKKKPWEVFEIRF